MEKALRHAVLAEPESSLPRFAYADWLEEHGQGLPAAYVRAEAELVALPIGSPGFADLAGRLAEIARSSDRCLGGWEHAPRLARIRDRVEWLARADANREIFGAQGHAYRIRPPLRDEELLAVERRLGALLPLEYRAFVLRVCNGLVGPGYGLNQFHPTGAGELDDLAAPCPLTDADAEVMLKAMQTGEMEGIPELPFQPPGTLPLADVGGGAVTYLVLNGQQRGKVWTAGPEFSGPDFDLDDFTPHTFLPWYEAWLGASLARFPGATAGE